MSEKFLDGKNKVSHISISQTTWRSAKKGISQIVAEKFTEMYLQFASIWASEVKIYQTSVSQICINFYL